MNLDKMHSEILDHCVDCKHKEFTSYDKCVSMQKIIQCKCGKKWEISLKMKL